MAVLRKVERAPLWQHRPGVQQITIPPGKAWPHQIVNTSSLPLMYTSVSTMALPEVCERGFE